MGVLHEAMRARASIRPSGPWHPRTVHRLLPFISAIAVLLAVSAAHGVQARPGAETKAEVEITYPEPRVVVGDVFAVSFDIANASTIEDPRVPSVPGLQSEVSRSREFSQTSIVNGRVTRRSSVHFDVLFVAEQPGTYELPKIRIVVDGLAYESRPAIVEVGGYDSSASARAELIATPENAVVGQNLSVRLRIWLKPYRSGRMGLGLDQQWSQSIKPRQSKWGIFQSAVEELYEDGRWRIPPRVEKDGDGTEWYVYEIGTTASADRPGPLDLGEVELRVGVRRPNGSERLVTLVPASPALVVEPVPSAGRPADFTGAVGSFEFEASAKPTRAGVGDPITLTLTIADRTPGGADLSRLLPPSLTTQPDLVRAFRVPDEPLAGTVNGRTKVFTQTIRPLSERVTEIPPLTFSFFDPVTRSFRSTQSDSIPVTILPAERMDAASLPGATAAAPRTDAPESALTEVEGGLVASLPASPSMLAVDRLSIGPGVGVLLILPPCAAVVAVVWRRRADRLGGNERLRRSRRAESTARRAIRTAPDAPAVLAAIRGYLADRSGLPAASLTRREAVALVQRHGAGDELSRPLDSLLASGDAATFAHRHAQSVDALRAGALLLLDGLVALAIPLSEERGA